MAAALAKVAVDENNVEQLVEVALYDGVAPELGFHHLLAHYGVCNAITAMDTVVFRLPLSVRQTTAAMLVRQLYGELMANIRREFDDRQELLPAGATLGQLVTSRTDLFAGQGCHVDASHLAAVVRHAEALEDLETIQLALALCQYGRLLHATCQYPGDDPFGDAYCDHQRFFAAQLGIDIEPAIAFFAEGAVRAENENVNTYPGEVYVALLARLGRFPEAIEASVRFLSKSDGSPGLAPTLLKLCEQLDDYGRDWSRVVVAATSCDTSRRWFVDNEQTKHIK